MHVVPSDITHRIGKFYLDPDLIKRAPGAIIEALKGCIVVRCEMQYYRHQFEYIAYCAAFDHTEAGRIVPEYECTIHQPKPLTYVIEWKRVDGKDS